MNIELARVVKLLEKVAEGANDAVADNVLMVLSTAVVHEEPVSVEQILSAVADGLGVPIE